MNIFSLDFLWLFDTLDAVKHARGDLSEVPAGFLFKSEQDPIPRISILIDGSNFYHLLKSIFPDHHLSAFDYKSFAKWLARDRHIVSKNYYIGAIVPQENNSKSQALFRRQRQLFARLESPHQKFSVKRGFLMRHGNTFFEKGVDVDIAVDILIGAYENLYDTVLLVSSDTDLIPAIKQAVLLGKQVIYVGFANRRSSALQRLASASYFLTPETLKPFLM